MLASLILVADFSRGCTGRGIGHLLFAPLPYRYVRFELLGAAQQCAKTWLDAGCTYDQSLLEGRDRGASLQRQHVPPS